MSMPGSLGCTQNLLMPQYTRRPPSPTCSSVRLSWRISRRGMCLSCSRAAAAARNTFSLRSSNASARESYGATILQLCCSVYVHAPDCSQIVVDSDGRLQRLRGSPQDISPTFCSARYVQPPRSWGRPATARTPSCCRATCGPDACMMTSTLNCHCTRDHDFTLRKHLKAFVSSKGLEAGTAHLLHCEAIHADERLSKCRVMHQRILEGCPHFRCHCGAQASRAIR